MQEAYVYVFHSAKCSHKKDRFYRRCKCSKWIYLARERKRISAKTRSWATAEEKAKFITEGQQASVNEDKTTIDEDNAPVIDERRTTISQAIEDYLKDKRSQGLAESTLYKLDIIFRKQLGKFCREHAIVHPEELTLTQVERFRASWRDQPLARRKKQERLVGFFAYCIAHKWMKENPAKQLSHVKVKDKPTLPFSSDEMSVLLAAIPCLYTDRRGLNGNSPESLRKRVLAMLLLLRWSGLRIGDAVSLERTRLTDEGRLFLRMAKTGTPVFVLIPEHITKLLHELPNSNPKYFFWTGNGLLKTAVADWQRTLKRLFKLANLGKRCHPHMLRDTFAVEYLVAGVPIDQVSILLGHSSVRITEKHYAPWVIARQQQLENSVRKAWTLSPGFHDHAAPVSASIN